jgi:hypothetical protein
MTKRVARAGALPPAPLLGARLFALLVHVQRILPRASPQGNEQASY